MTQEAGGGAGREARSGGSGGHAVALEGLVDGFDEVAEVEGLGEVIEGTEAHGFDGRFDAAMAGDHDDGGVGELVPAHADKVEAVHIADAEVHDDEFGLVGADGGDAIESGGAAENLMTGCLAELGHEFEDRGFVVYDY